MGTSMVSGEDFSEQTNPIGMFYPTLFFTHGPMVPLRSPHPLSPPLQ